jgi:ParB-like chromosome segregation protein Spo0J
VRDRRLLALRCSTPFGPTVAQIAASIREFGFTSPILVDNNAGVIAGHGRLLGARKLQLSEVPVIVLDHLSEAQKRAYILADNRLAELSGWDDDLLREQLAELKDADFSLDAVGSSDDELRVLLGNEACDDAPPPGEDAIPAPPVDPIWRPGDIWQIGSKHRLICGDCRG